MNAFVLQMTSTPNVSENIDFVKQALLKHNNDEALTLNGSIVVLPECFACFGGKDKLNLTIAEGIGQGLLNAQSTESVQHQLSQLAKEFGIYLVAGSFPTIEPHQESLDKATELKTEEKFSATSLVFNPSGDLVADYQKIHLFDVEVDDNTGSYRESDSTLAGNKVVLFDTKWGKIGIAICYDLRFPGLFQELRRLGSDAVVLPSAFTERTGQAHWLPLIQARAIENQIYMIASNQNGVHQNGRETYGHSMIVSPWGDVLANAKRDNGLFGAIMEQSNLQNIRAKMPVFSHNQFNYRLQSSSDNTPQ